MGYLRWTRFELNKNSVWLQIESTQFLKFAKQGLPFLWFTFVGNAFWAAFPWNFPLELPICTLTHLILFGKTTQIIVTNETGMFYPSLTAVAKAMPIIWFGMTMLKNGIKIPNYSLAIGHHTQTAQVCLYLYARNIFLGNAANNGNVCVLISI